MKVMLRALELEDSSLIYEWENDFSLWEFSSTTRPFSHFAVEAYVKTSQNADIYSEGQMRLMIDIQPKEEEQMITVGCVDMFDIDPVNLRAAVGIFVEEKYRNQKIANQALQQLWIYATQALNLNQLYAFVAQDNIASKNLFYKSGYQNTAVLKQWIKRGKTYLDIFVYQKIVK